MIDWLGVGGNSLWVLGLTAVFATISWASWWAATRGIPLRAAIATASARASLGCGFALISAGLFLSARSAPERILWAAFFLCSALMGLGAARSSRDGTAVPTERSGEQPHTRVGSTMTVLNKAARYVARAEPWLLLGVILFLLLPVRLTPLLAVLLVLPSLARRLTLGRFTTRTPADGAILVLLLMLPVSLWASADMRRSLPQAYGLLLGLAAFYAVVNYVQRPAQAWLMGVLLAMGGLGLSVVSLVCIDWSSLGELGLAFASGLQLNPAGAVVTPAWSGLTTYDVESLVALSVPFVASLLLLGFFRPGRTGAVQPVARQEVGILWRSWRRVLPVLLALGLLVMVSLLVLTQSLSALLGICAALLMLSTYHRKWLGPGLALLIVLCAVAWLHLGPEQISDSVVDAGAQRHLRARQEILQRALFMIQDFPYTGVGLNAFPAVVNVLYPLTSLAPEQVFRLTDAHSSLLQVAVDLGLPGLIAYLAVLLASGASWWTHCRRFPAPWLRALGLALLCGILGYTVHGIADTVTLGAKLDVASWAMLGLLAALANLSVRPTSNVAGRLADVAGPMRSPVQSAAEQMMSACGAPCSLDMQRTSTTACHPAHAIR